MGGKGCQAGWPVQMRNDMVGLGQCQEVRGETGGVGRGQARFRHSMALLMTGMSTRSAGKTRRGPTKGFQPWAGAERKGLDDSEHSTLAREVAGGEVSTLMLFSLKPHIK